MGFSRQECWSGLPFPSPVDHVLLEKTLESPMDCKEIEPVNPRGNQPWIFIGRTDAEAEAPILWPPDEKCQLIRKDPDAGRVWGQGKERDDRGWDGWMASLTQWTWVWASSGSWWWTGKPGMLQTMRSRRAGHNWVTEQQQNNPLLMFNLYLFSRANFLSLWRSKTLHWHLNEPQKNIHSSSWGPLFTSAKLSLLDLVPCILWCSSGRKLFAIFQMWNRFYVLMLLFTLPRKTFLTVSTHYQRLNTGWLLLSSQRPVNCSLFPLFFPTVTYPPTCHNTHNSLLQTHAHIFIYRFLETKLFDVKSASYSPLTPQGLA